MNDKQKALEQAIAQIEKQFGKGSIMKLGESQVVNVNLFGSIGNKTTVHSNNLQKLQNIFFGSGELLFFFAQSGNVKHEIHTIILY